MGDSCTISDHMVAFWEEKGRPWLVKGEVFLLFSDQEKARDFAIVPGCPAQRMVVQLMEGYDNVLETLQTVQSAGAQFVVVDPPPGDGVKLTGMGIEQAKMEIQQILQGREDLCRVCGLRMIECACEQQAEA